MHRVRSRATAASGSDRRAAPPPRGERGKPDGVMKQGNKKNWLREESTLEGRSNAVRGTKGQRRTGRGCAPVQRPPLGSPLTTSPRTPLQQGAGQVGAAAFSERQPTAASGWPRATVRVHRCMHMAERGPLGEAGLALESRLARRFGRRLRSLLCTPCKLWARAYEGAGERGAPPGRRPRLMAGRAGCRSGGAGLGMHAMRWLCCRKLRVADWHGPPASTLSRPGSTSAAAAGAQASQAGPPPPQVLPAAQCPAAHPSG